MGIFRCYGTTTAEILRDLLVDKPPLDYTKRYVNRREEIYREELLKIKSKLDIEGIPTRKVATTAKQLQEYMIEYESRKKEISK